VMVQKSWMQSRKVVGPQTTKLSCWAAGFLCAPLGDPMATVTEV
jgi:hypothetical protein